MVYIVPVSSVIYDIFVDRLTYSTVDTQRWLHTSTVSTR